MFRFTKKIFITNYKYSYSLLTSIVNASNDTSLSKKVFVPNKTKNLNLSVFNTIIGINE